MIRGLKAEQKKGDLCVLVRGLKGEQKKGDSCDGKKVYRKSKRKEICVMVRDLGESSTNPIMYISAFRKAFLIKQIVQRRILKRCQALLDASFFPFAAKN